MSPASQQEASKVALGSTPEQHSPMTAVSHSSNLTIQRTASALDISFQPQGLVRSGYLEIPLFCIVVTGCFVAAGVVGKSSDFFLALILIGIVIGCVGCFLGILRLLEERPTPLHIDTSEWSFGKTRGPFAKLTRAQVETVDCPLNEQERSDPCTHKFPGDDPHTSAPVTGTEPFHTVILIEEGLVEHHFGQCFDLSMADAVLIARLVNEFIAEHRGDNSAV